MIARAGPGLLAGPAAALAVLWAGAAGAHEFWLQPQRFQVAPNVPTPAVLMVGAGEDRERWAAARDRVTSLDVRGPAGRRDLRAALRPPGGASDAVLSYAGPGLHVVSLTTRNALSVLPAGRFDDYLADSGLGAALAQRTAAGGAGKPGRELYSRRAKALVRVGGGGPGDDVAAVTPVGLTLEIVPERNPYHLAAGEALPVRVLYLGRPLAGATVKLFCLDLDHRALARRITDADGRASFAFPRRGDWLISVIWTRRIASPQADFETVFSSLTFGYPG